MKINLFRGAIAVALAAVALATNGCAVQSQKMTTLPVVGPSSPSRSASDGGPGELIVYSAIHAEADSGAAMTYPHSLYRIYGVRGSLVRLVQNHSGSLGESPEIVNLAPGMYKVIAESESQGIVAVPVIVKSNLITEVRLTKAVRTISPDAFASH